MDEGARVNKEEVSGPERMLFFSMGSMWKPMGLHMNTGW